MDENDDRAPLTVPALEDAHYAKNFIRLATCELRFPTLLELEESAPLTFSKMVRKEYPSYSALRNLNINSTGVAQATSHTFVSTDRRWTLSVRSSALSLETASYHSFAEFEARLVFVLKAAEKTIDSDIFTRVGLRYINALPFERGTIQKWIRPSLVKELSDGTFGDADEHWSRVRGAINGGGGYIFQHGISAQAVPSSRREYLLDLDFYREFVPVSQTLEAVKSLHKQEFATFHWCLGEEAIKFLGPSKMKKAKK